MTLFLAGHETTAVALSWTWYLLAQHPEVDARLADELRAVLGGRRAHRGRSAAPALRRDGRRRSPCASTRRRTASDGRRREPTEVAGHPVAGRRSS